MNVLILRGSVRKDTVISTVSVDGVFFCYCLEDMPREVKIQNETAIPAGEYNCIISFSPRFKREMPILLNVPFFSGVRIHNGKDKNSTEGCLIFSYKVNMENMTCDIDKSWVDFLQIMKKNGGKCKIIIK